MTISPTFADVLNRTEALLAEPLLDAVLALPGPVQPVIAHHFGWDDFPLRATGVGGKAVRATLVMLAAETAGAPVEVAVPGAVAVELVHNFTLLHDDVMDGDTERRHRLAAWTVFGQPLALLAGTSLHARAQALLMGAGLGGPLASLHLEEAIQLLIAGQALDVSFEGRGGVTVPEWTAMATGKTASLLAASAAIGALLASAPDPLVDALTNYGLHLGVAYQAVDDVLGIWGSPAVTGKPAGNDLRTGKPTLPVVAAIATGGPFAARLAELLAAPTRDEADVVEMVSLIEANGGRDAALSEAARRLDLALAAIDAVDMPAGIAADLRVLAHFMTARDR